MNINYNGTLHRTAFRNLKPGEMFRNENCLGLFIRLPEGCKEPVMIIDPLPNSRTAGKAGELSDWADDDNVYPVKSLDVTLYTIGE